MVERLQHTGGDMPVIGDCPHDCGEVAFRPGPTAGEVQFLRDECERCGGVVWTRLSRVDPWAMTEEDFLAEYEVDEETKSVVPRPTTAQEDG